MSTLFKIKLTQKIEVKELFGRSLVYKGHEVLAVPKGVILKVLKSVSNEGDIIMRTNNNQNPFITLFEKNPIVRTIPSDEFVYWGSSIQEYIFEVLPFASAHDYIDTKKLPFSL
jgi:hypothetical protein